jgi:serine/threonine protein kinase/tetratricopeptide (TPR) repeat protein
LTQLQDQLQEALGATYAIEREIGGGGMSRVFLAKETSLGRRVVVKLLPSELAGSVSVARFRREILLAALLQHPHIVPLLAAGDLAGLPYFIMPFVDGESLRGKLAHGELPMAEVISVLRDVAKALAFAHSKGVTHRDIKPENVLLAGTSAVIMDFGVAKALSDSAAGDSGKLTSIGVALGTPAYMAPEQAMADPTTDVRADIYAFGVMAYEMLAGHTPFAGRNMQATLAAHATERPTSIASQRPSTPARLADIVMRCLEKRPGDRPQSAEEIVGVLDSIGVTTGTAAVASQTTPPLVAAPDTRQKSPRVAGVIAVVAGAVALLVWWSARPGTTPDLAAGLASTAVQSIAVLPFENMSGDTTFDYLEDGITDHVRDALNAIPELAVKARSSSQQLKGRNARAIGSKLGVGLILQGTVSRSGSRLHVTTELVRVADEVGLWSGTFDREADALSGIQDTIARAVAGKLRVGQAGASAGLPTAVTRGTADAEAYDRFLRGRHAFDRFDLVRAETLFREALVRDPRFARAQGFLAMTYANAPIVGVTSLDSALTLARLAATKALDIDSTIVEAYITESFILASEMHFADAVKPLEKALAFDSRNIDVLSAYGLALTQVGRIAEALEQSRRARELDPLSLPAIGLRAYVLATARQYDQAIAEAKLTVDLDPKFALARRELGFLYAFTGRPDSAVAEFQAAFKLNPTQLGGRSNLVFGYAVAGRWADAARERAAFDRDTSGNSPNYNRMLVHLAYAKNDSAMTMLEQGIASREPLFSNISIPCDPMFDPLKSDRRFSALMERIGAHACAASGQWPISKRR